MEDFTKFRRISLPDYLIEQGAGSDLRVQASILSKIYSGDLRATITLPSMSLPAGASMASVLRHAMDTRNDSRVVPAISWPKAKAEIGKAARGHHADWALLDSLILFLPATIPAVQPNTKAIPREVANKENILEALKALGHNPLSLPASDGKAGVRKQVRDYIGKKLPDSAFKKAWQALRNDGLIKNK